MKERGLGALEDMLEACRQAQAFVESHTYEQFAQDTRTQFAVVRALEILGEATKRVPDEIREQHPSLPWSSMARMRDKLIHHYSQVNYLVV